MEARRRAANFTADGKIAVLSLIKEYKHVIECKRSDAITWKEKESAWEEITARFNASNTILEKRSKDNLKKFYENKKKEARKVAANDRLERFKTGGGPSTSTISDPTFDLTMSILNTKSVLGLPSMGDSDQDFENIYIYVIQDDQEETSNPETVEVESKKTVDWGDFKAQNLRTPTSKALKSDQTWTSRRRPSLAASTLSKKYDELVDVKKDLGLLQLEILKRDKEDREQRYVQDMEERKVRMSREEEEFKLKREPLLLDIEIKTKQLAALNKL